MVKQLLSPKQILEKINENQKKIMDIKSIKSSSEQREKNYKINRDAIFSKNEILREGLMKNIFTALSDDEINEYIKYMNHAYLTIHNMENPFDKINFKAKKQTPAKNIPIIIKKMGDNFLNPELQVFLKNSNYQNIPKYGKENFVLEKGIPSGSNQQGKNNGPDFIFNDKSNRKKIGVEVCNISQNTLLIKRKNNVLISDDKMENIKSNFNKTNNFITSDKEYYDRIESICSDKTKKSANYIKTDILYLVLVNIQPEYEIPGEGYSIAEMIVNNNTQYSKFNKIYLI